MLRSRALTTGLVTALISGGLALVAAPAQAATPSLRIADLRTTETAATRTVTITRAAPTTTKVTVKVASANGTAVAPADYAAVAPTTVTFLAGQTTRTVSVAIKADALDEPDETFSLKLSSPVGATIADGLGVVTIVDDDAAPTLTMTTQSVAEGSSNGPVDHLLTASLSAPSGRAVSAAYAFVQGTATSGVDYEPGSGTISIPAGTTSKTFPLAVEGDLADENDERLYVQLTSPVNATVATTYTRVTLVDDDAPMTPQLFPLAATTGSTPTITLKGAATSGNSVNVYEGASCAGPPVLTSTAEALGSGLTVDVPDNATTAYTVRSANALAEPSACSNVVSYTHDDVAPDAPSFPQLIGANPSNGNTITVAGFTDAGNTVLAYKDACASSPVAKAKADAFGTATVSVTVPDNTTTSFWEQAVDAAGNRSTCASAGTFVEDSIVPGSVSVFSVADHGYGSAPKIQGSAESGATIEVYATDASFSACQGSPVGSFSAAALGAGTARVPFDAGASLTSYRILVQVDAAGNRADCIASGYPLTYTDDATETEDNGTAATADLGSTGIGTFHQFGELADDTDKDYFSVVVPSGGGLSAETLDVPGGPTCLSTQLDTNIRIFDPSGTQLASDDDAGVGFCSLKALTALPAGTYTVQVTTTPFGGGSLVYPLPYDLRLIVTTAPTTAEVESNDTAGTANALGAVSASSPKDATGATSGTSDKDYFSFTVAGAQSVTFETVDGTVPGSCVANTEDTAVTVYGTDGTTQLGTDDDNGAGFCSKLTVALPAAGTYYVKVSDSALIGTPVAFTYRLQLR